MLSGLYDCYYENFSVPIHSLLFEKRMNLNRYNKNVTLEWNEKTFLLYIAWSPTASLSQISWLKFEPWSQIFP